VPNEDECLPSFGALYFHFLRGLFALKMWEQACDGQIKVPVITEHGNQRKEERLEIVHDYPATIERIKQQVASVLKGCGCKVTGCKNKKCKCRAAGQVCTASCRCAACLNTTLAPSAVQQPVTNQRTNNSIRPTILEAVERPEVVQIPIQQDIGDEESSKDEDNELEEVDEWQNWDEHLPEGGLAEIEQGALSRGEAEEDGDNSDLESDSDLGPDDDEGDTG
jgi:hypothetical protein